MVRCTKVSLVALPHLLVVMRHILYTLLKSSFLKFANYFDLRNASELLYQ